MRFVRREYALQFFPEDTELAAKLYSPGPGQEWAFLKDKPPGNQAILALTRHSLSSPTSLTHQQFVKRTELD